MGILNLTKLQPGRSYSVVVRARNDSGLISENSPFYTFTVPSTNIDGTQLTSTNSAVVTALAPDSSSTVGGALIAGGLDATGAAQAGALNLGSVWNNTASSIAKLTGTASSGAVIINSTGILGYQLTSTSSGQANFFLDTASGNAYFRGTVYANAGQIGGFLINNSSLSASTFFNKLTSYDPSFEDNWLNYWTASADYFGSLDMSLTLKNDATITPVQAGLKYAKFSVYAFGNGSPNITGSSMAMMMFKSASVKTAFSQSDLGISSGRTYTLSVYAQDLGSDSYGTPLPAKLFLQINKYSSATTSSATFTGSVVSTVITTSSTAWTRISASFTSASSEYYTFYIINAEDYQASPPGTARYVDSSFAIDAIQLEVGNTAGTFGFDNYFSVSPADSKPINLSSISNTGSTSNIFSVYTDGGVYANYFFSNKQSKIGSVYFGGNKSSNISIGDYFATNQDNTNGNNINIGNLSLSAHVSGSNNIAIGYNAAGYVGYGSNNVVIGGYTGELYWSDGNVILADGAGNIRIKANSAGLVTIPGSASVSGSVYAGTIVGSIASATYAASSVYSSSALYSSSAGYLPVSGLSASTITIGSTIIGLGNTSASLSGLATFDLTNNATSSANIFSISSVASTGEKGGKIDINTSAQASGAAGTSTGGAINISTTANQSGATATATGGAITISTQGSGTGTLGSIGGNILITTTKSGTNSTAGGITLTSNGNFSISTVNVGTIDNFNIGATTAGTGKFTTLNATGAINGTTASYTGLVTAASFVGNGSGITGITGYLSANDYYTSQLTPTTSIDLFPRTAISGTRTLAVGSIYSTGFVPVKSFTLNSVTIVLTATPTSSIQFALISTSGSTQTVVASTGSAVPSGAGAYTASFATPQTLTAGQSYAIGALAVGGTVPTLVGQTISTTHAAISYGLYPLMAAVSSTTTYTSIPAAGNTIAINTATPPASFFWARLS